MIEPTNTSSPYALDSDTYGQEAEYKISAVVLHALLSPFVVDVGVEKGSFIDLALRSGASRVVGFEPLPRHQEFLQQRFRETQKVVIHPIAISDLSATAELHIALDRDGNELDYHHTLGDLGDSATVVRSQRTIKVETASLNDLVRAGTLPAQIDFLKIDTDGHDLSVLEGLRSIQPRVILAEYWDTLPATSGKNLYTLQDMVTWARKHGYNRQLTVRRHGSIELIERDSSFTVPGDWGNVFFFRDDFSLESIWEACNGIAMRCYQAACSHIQTLSEELEKKEVEIRRLDQRLRSVAPHVGASATNTSPKLTQDRSGQQFISPLDKLRQQLEDKEKVIWQQARDLETQRAANFLARPLIPLLRPFRGFFRLLMPKLGRLQHHPPVDLVLPRRHVLKAGLAIPSISIVTPSFKQGRFIQRTIDSVLEQKYPRLEYFVQDGGSRDGTVEILQCNEHRLTGWSSNPDTGQSNAINIGFQRTDGEIMAWLNSDDLLLPGALSRVAEYFVTHPEIDVVYGHRILIDEEDREIGRWILPRHNNRILSWADFVPQETLFWRRRIWEKVGSEVDENFRFAMDWDLLLRFRRAGAKMARLPYFMGAFRIHDLQKTSASINEIGMAEMAILRSRELKRNPSSRSIRLALIPYLVCHIAHDLAVRVRKRLHLIG